MSRALISPRPNCFECGDKYDDVPSQNTVCFSRTALSPLSLQTNIREDCVSQVYTS